MTWVNPSEARSVATGGCGDEGWLRLAFELAPQAIAVTSLDGQGRFLHVNPAACELLGYPEAEFLALTLLDLFPPEDRADQQRILAAYGQDGGRRQSERRLRHADGHYFWGQLSSVVTGNPPIAVTHL